jgi:DNA-binding MarR family transcriptional regulator
MVVAANQAPPSVPDQPAAGARPQGCTNFKLRQLLRVVARRYDEQLARVGVKGTQFSLLSYLVAAGPAMPSRVAADMGLDNSTLTRNLAVLADLGWVQVGAGPDARSRRVAITDAGRAKRAEALPHWKAAQLEMNARLGEPDVLALHALIDRSFQRLTDDTDSEGPAA